MKLSNEEIIDIAEYLEAGIYGTVQAVQRDVFKYQREVSDEDIEKIKAAGFDDFISKPISEEALKIVLKGIKRQKKTNPK